MPDDNPYVTKLSPEEERKFQAWVKANNIPWQDSPTADYDMRGYWKATGGKVPSTGNRHFPDKWKTPYHKTFSNESIYAKGLDAPHWEGDKLIDSRGRVVADESPALPPPLPQSGPIAPGSTQAFWDKRIRYAKMPTGKDQTIHDTGPEPLNQEDEPGVNIYPGMKPEVKHGRSTDPWMARPDLAPGVPFSGGMKTEAPSLEEETSPVSPSQISMVDQYEPPAYDQYGNPVDRPHLPMEYPPADPGQMQLSHPYHAPEPPEPQNLTGNFWENTFSKQAMPPGPALPNPDDPYAQYRNTPPKEIPYPYKMPKTPGTLDKRMSHRPPPMPHDPDEDPQDIEQDERSFAKPPLKRTWDMSPDYTDLTWEHFPLA